MDCCNKFYPYHRYHPLNNGYIGNTINRIGTDTPANYYPPHLQHPSLRYHHQFSAHRINSSNIGYNAIGPPQLPPPPPSLPITPNSRMYQNYDRIPPNYPPNFTAYPYDTGTYGYNTMHSSRGLNEYYNHSGGNFNRMNMIGSSSFPYQQQQQQHHHHPYSYRNFYSNMTSPIHNPRNSLYALKERESYQNMNNPTGYFQPLSSPPNICRNRGNDQHLFNGFNSSSKDIQSEVFDVNKISNDSRRDGRESANDSTGLYSDVASTPSPMTNVSNNSSCSRVSDCVSSTSAVDMPNDNYSPVLMNYELTPNSSDQIEYQSQEIQSQEISPKSNNEDQFTEFPSDNDKEHHNNAKQCSTVDIEKNINHNGNIESCSTPLHSPTFERNTDTPYTTIPTPYPNSFDDYSYHNQTVEQTNENCWLSNNSWTQQKQQINNNFKKSLLRKKSRTSSKIINKNQVLESDVIPSKKSKRKVKKESSNDITNDNEEGIKNVIPLPGFQQAFGSTEIGRFSGVFFDNKEAQSNEHSLYSEYDDMMDVSSFNPDYCEMTKNPNDGSHYNLHIDASVQSVYSENQNYHHHSSIDSFLDKNCFSQIQCSDY